MLGQDNIDRSSKAGSCAAEGRKLQVFPDTTLFFFTLSALAIGQPLFDLVAENPEFLTAHGVGAIEILGLVSVPCLILPIALILVQRLCAAIHDRAGQMAGLLITIALFLALASVFAQASINQSGWIVVAVAVCIALGFTGLWIATRWFGGLLNVLAMAIPLIPVVFLLSPGVMPLWRVAKLSEITTVFKQTPPIVLVVFDELDLTALMDIDGAIDRGKYPNFARLAGQSTWYKNAAAVSVETAVAIPVLLTGHYPEGHQAPTSAQHPDSLFTLISPAYGIVAHESVTHLCPMQICRLRSDQPGSRFSRLLADSGIVLLHLLLPRDLTYGLPPIDTGWSNFQSEFDNDRAGEWQAFVASITAPDTSTGNMLYYYHLLLPHSPYQYLSTGVSYGRRDGQLGIDPGGRWAENEAVVAHAHQRYLLQLAYLDSLLGDLLDRLVKTGLMDSALLIVTADHGVSFRACDWRRKLTNSNLVDVLPIPLFIKRPGQSQGHVDHRLAQSTDILPTIVDVLGVSLPWTTDGTSLFSEETASRDSFVVFDDQLIRHQVSNELIDRAAAVRRRLDLFPEYKNRDDFPHIGNPRLNQPPSASLIEGNRVTSTSIDDADSSTASHQVVMLKGKVELSGSLDSSNLKLALVWEGTVKAIAGPHGRRGNVMKFSALVPRVEVRPQNDGWRVLSFDSSPVTKPLDRSRTDAFLLSEDDSRLVIKSLDGQQYEIVGGEVAGWVDGFRDDGGSVMAYGWAGDTAVGRVAQHVLAFSRGELVAQGTTGVSRPDVAGVFDAAGLGESGFELKLPQNTPLACLRFFALSEAGIASELTVTPQGLLNTSLMEGD